MSLECSLCPSPHNHCSPQKHFLYTLRSQLPRHPSLSKLYSPLQPASALPFLLRTKLGSFQHISLVFIFAVLPCLLLALSLSHSIPVTKLEKQLSLMGWGGESCTTHLLITFHCYDYGRHLLAAWRSVWFTNMIQPHASQSIRWYRME